MGQGLWHHGWEAQERGNEKLANENFAAAEKALSRAKQLGVNSGNYLSTLGILYFTRGNYIEAAATFQEATRIDPSSALFFYWLGRSKLQIGGQESLKEARNAMERAVELKPDDSDSHYWHGVLFVKLQQYTAAMTELQRSIELDSKNLKAYKYLTLATMMVPKANRADRREQVSTYERALKHASDGIAIAKLQKDAHAASEIEKLQHALWNTLAFTYADLGEYLQLAETYIDRALSADPNNPNYFDTKAWILMRSSEVSTTLSNEQREDKLRQAEDLLDKALNSLPQDDTNRRADVIYHLGYVERLHGRNEAARSRFLEALELNPEYQNAKEAINR